MADLNNVTLIGRLTRDAESKITAGGVAVSKFSIAVNRRKKNGDVWEDEANFFDIVLWGRSAESLTQYLLKGKQVGIAGELRQDRWQQDGQNRSKVEIVASSVQLLGGGNNSRDQGDYSGDHDNRSGQRNGKRNETRYETRDNADGFVDDIPF
jgi:single-strand DNA-binding protein